LLEVIGGFGNGHVDPNRRLFEVAFGSTQSVPLSTGESLRLFLTSPEELEIAVQKKWTSLRPIREAIVSGEGKVLFKDSIGSKLLNSLAGKRNSRTVRARRAAR
jgi:hypothetical protein